jgi:cell division protein FtsZ
MHYLFSNQNKNFMTPFEFDFPTDQNSIIKVIGVGGGGGNAVNHMFEQGIEGVNFIVCNTDAQALHASPVPNKIQLGPKLTEGLGAGANPEVGMQACEESLEEIKAILSKNTKMLFITAGMGGGTGTGAAPVVARVAREMGILTVAIVTTPFSFEGKKRFQVAIEGINKLREQVDTILVIGNDKIRMMYGNLTQSQAFSHANNILTTAAKSISEIITKPGIINRDFADVRTVMTNGGSAIMGSAFAEGTDRANLVIQAALNSPLLNDSDITGAKYVLINIASGEDEVRIDEIDTINDYIQTATNQTDIILGTSRDLSLGNKLMVTVIATGFETKLNESYTPVQRMKVYDLEKHTFSPPTPAEEKTSVTTAPSTDSNIIVHLLEEEEEKIHRAEENQSASTTQSGEFSESPSKETNSIDEDGFVVQTPTQESESTFDLFSGLEQNNEANTIELEVNNAQRTDSDHRFNEIGSSQQDGQKTWIENTCEEKPESTNENLIQESEPYVIYKRHQEVENIHQIKSDEVYDLRKQRLMQLSKINFKKSSPELEKPAINRNETLTNNNNPVSKSSLHLSQFSITVSENDNNGPEIKKENKFINGRPC